jgi:hypothetical protein
MQAPGGSGRDDGIAGLDDAPKSGCSPVMGLVGLVELGGAVGSSATLLGTSEEAIHDDSVAGLLMPGSCMPGPDPEAPSDQLQQPRAWSRLACAAVRSRSPPSTRSPCRVLESGVHYRRVPTAMATSGWRWRSLQLSGTRCYFPRDHILELCQIKIRQIVEARPQVNYKIGLTTDCEARLFGYKQEGARVLVVVHQTPSVSDAVYFETGCISCFAADSRCRNVAPGGEGMSRGVSPVFLYVALGGPPRTRPHRG